MPTNTKKGFSSHDAANLQTPVSFDNILYDENTILKSNLFKGDKILQIVLENKIVIRRIATQPDKIFGVYIEKIQKALILLLPGTVPIAQSHSSDVEIRDSLVLGNKFDEKTEYYLSQYQTNKFLTDNTGTINYETLIAMEEDLASLGRCNTLEVREVIPGDAIYIDKFMSVFKLNSPNQISNVYIKPDPASGIIFNAIRNDKVFVEKIFKVDAVSWAKILFDYKIPHEEPVIIMPRTIDGININLPDTEAHYNIYDTKTAEGYIILDDLWTKSEITDPGAELLSIPLTATILDILTAYGFQSIDSSNEDKALFYAQAILFANNPFCKSTQIRYNLSETDGTYSVVENITSPIFVSSTGSSIFSSIFDFLGSLLNVNLSLIDLPFAANFTLNNLWFNDRGNPNGWYNFIKSFLDISGEIDLASIQINPSTVSDEHVMWLPSPQYLEGLYETTLINTLGTSQDMAENFVENITLFLQDTITIMDSITNTLVNITRQDFLVQKLNEFMPVGTGLSIAGNLGATFGIPVGLDVEYKCYLWRKDEDTIVLRKRGTLAAGLDTGVGAGFFMGTGRKKSFKNSSNQDKRYGLGAEVGASLRVMPKVVITQEFEFPFKKDWNILNLLIATFNLEFTADMLHCFSFLTGFKFFNLEPLDYLTKIIIQPGAFIEGNAAASARVAVGSNDEYATWQDDTTPKTIYEKPSGSTIATILSLLNLTFGITVGAEIANGIEINLTDRIHDPDSWIMIPTKINLSLYSEGSVALDLKLKLPFISFPVTLDFGCGCKTSFEYLYDAAHYQSGANSTNPPKFVFKDLSFYVKSGSIDENDFTGSAYIVELVMAQNVPNNPTAPVEFSMQYFSEVKITRRIGLELGKKIAQKNSLSINTDKFSKTWGATAYGYIEGEFYILKNEVLNFINLVINDYTQSGNHSIQEALFYLLSYLRPGITVPTEVPGLIKDFFALIHIKKLRVHAGIAGSIGFKAYLADLGKARIQAGMEGTIFYENDNMGSPAQIAHVKNAFENGKRTFIEFFYANDKITDMVLDTSDPGSLQKNNYHKKNTR